MEKIAAPAGGRACPQENMNLKTLGLYQDLIKQWQAFKDMMFAERKTMGINLGTLGSAIGNVAGALGKGANGMGNIGRGIESGGGSLRGAASVSGLARMDLFIPRPIINEGPVGKAALNLTVPLGEIKFQNKSLPVRAAPVPLQGEIPWVQRAMMSPALPDLQIRKKMPTNILWFADYKKPNRVVLPLPNIIEFPKPKITPDTKPAAQVALSPAAKTENKTSTKTNTAAAVQPAQEEEIAEEIVTERVTNKQIDIVREEIEKFKLKVVVDEEVLENRIIGLTDTAKAAASGEDGVIEGKKIVEMAPPENEDKRSGIIKKNGPDGSWVETLEEIAARRFNSVKEAKKQIAEIINRKVPVKRAVAGREAGDQAVARVLKYLFVKSMPVKEVIKRVTKKQKKQVVHMPSPLPLIAHANEEPKEEKIEDFPTLAGVFQKRAA